MQKTSKKSALRILDIDPWLKPYEPDIKLRVEHFDTLKNQLIGSEGRWKDFANGHLYFGFQFTEAGCFYREWAPAAKHLALIGDFNGWNPNSHPMTRTDAGNWEIFIPKETPLLHQSLVKVRVHIDNGFQDRIPLYIRRTVQNPEDHTFCGQIWNPDTPFLWSDDGFLVSKEKPLCIYEAHIGMAQEKEAVGTYREFADITLPRIAAGGYTAIQLMAIMEHPYYGSFGYHVSNFFAAASWFGTPEDLKYLVDKAHSMGIAVLMDLVQSHAVKNTAEGIASFDGTHTQFFHDGSRGYHKAWDSMLFNYGKHEVIHFLLSSIKFWMEEYHFDGFRFDGITSMLYHDHGLGTAFDTYRKYFSLNTDVDAIAYLQMANLLIKELRPDAISIAEDMSGMPGIALPVADGGIGFDYRLSMGIPDLWIKMMKTSDDHWNMHHLWHELTTHRPQEKRIAYAESHDQALVGDKTIMFWLADKDMYWDMEKGRNNANIDRAIALHKMIRLVTLTTGAEGYLNFMGNEFGHPEWIDFPREGNQWSFSHCRRQWSLAESPFLRYEYLYRFDREMLSLARDYALLKETPIKNLWLEERTKTIAYRCGNLIYLFNFHPTRSYQEFQLPIHEPGSWQVVLDTDEERFGGQDRISHSTQYPSVPLNGYSGQVGITIYLPSRTALVLKKD